MKAIVYWDVDSPRIRKVLAELESDFEIRLASTLGDLLRTSARDNDICAALIGYSSADVVSVAKLIDQLSSLSRLPVFLLTERRCGLSADLRKTSVFIYLEELPLLRFKILAADELRKREDSNASMFIGKSKAMRDISSLVRKYADSSHPVLILGETGTGKELVARALHTCSSRRDQVFIALNCSALPESLAESEMFGTEKGAFTDAVPHKGALKKAEKSTLFLDEIASMSLAVQPKLLRALELGEFWKLGAEKAEKSDFRLVSATCANLEAQVARGLFRADLFFRISDLPVVVPPLRERMEDVADLSHHFCLQEGKGWCELSEAAVAKLMGYRWPGNVRELKSVLNRACANVQRGRIEAEDIVFMFGLEDAWR
ncbi:MAG: hypothetical protein CVV53_04310 [Spirochaetae bacterium HGW-Spirochaetae-9]|nr:MAG: hypothetical protein CVV53_04310 [Spirochaetae bacterium HGW-Spirochaetae-9]